MFKKKSWHLNVKCMYIFLTKCLFILLYLEGSAWARVREISYKLRVPPQMPATDGSGPGHGQELYLSVQCGCQRQRLSSHLLPHTHINKTMEGSRGGGTLSQADMGYRILNNYLQPLSPNAGFSKLLSLIKDCGYFQIHSIESHVRTGLSDRACYFHFSKDREMYNHEFPLWHIMWQFLARDSL